MWIKVDPMCNFDPVRCGLSSVSLAGSMFAMAAGETDAKAALMEAPEAQAGSNAARTDPAPQSQAEFYRFGADGTMTKVNLAIGDQVLLTTEGETATGLAGTPKRDIPYMAATVTNTGVEANNTPTEIQMQETALNGTHIETSCATRCSQRGDPSDYSLGRFTDTISVGSGAAFQAEQHFYLGNERAPASIVLRLEPGKYQLGTSTLVEADKNAITRKIQ
jgi:hypothetical protein